MLFQRLPVSLSPVLQHFCPDPFLGLSYLNFTPLNDRAFLIMENGPQGCLQTATNVICLLLPSSYYLPATLPCVLMWPNSSQFNTICTLWRGCANHLESAMRASCNASRACSQMHSPLFSQNVSTLFQLRMKRRLETLTSLAASRRASLVLCPCRPCPAFHLEIGENQL